ncbi:PREDICTED: nicotianamine synthase-like [Ipomoea nil]|uniref:nicotianamine synthase-like n=1 Tax=Ipomoea nil TaxID=35883 RepID=UPI000900A539|nr:PREDICTED: nicotianamine synthase-like [Ipomoea nil]
MVCQKNPVVQKICELYDEISRLENLKPSEDVDTLFTQLVHTCIPPNPIDVSKLCSKIQEMRSNLIRLCGEAEGLLESHYSTILASLPDPLKNLSLFPYFNNYLKLSLLEFDLLSRHYSGGAPRRLAFVGSGPLPLSSIVLATCHLTATDFHNYDIDPAANAMAARLVGSDPGLSGRMFFHTADIMGVTCDLKEYDVVFLAALVGMDKEEKERAIDHLAKYMAPGSLLVVRSAHGARAFLYPVVEPCDLRGFEVLTVYHPTDDVINSVIVARKMALPLPAAAVHSYDNREGSMVLPSKCSCAEIHAFNPLNKLSMIEEFSLDQE